MNVMFTAGKFYATDNNGVPLVGGKVWAYASPDTSTPATTYSNQECTAANPWPIVLDARGEWPVYVKAETDFYLTIPTATDISSVIWTSRKVGEQQTAPLTGSATPGTTHNNYVVTITPAPLALTNNLMVIWTPDVDNTSTTGATVFTGTGINDGVFSGPYIGSTAGSVFTVQIDGVGTPDTFKWKKDGGAWTSLVPITAIKQTLYEGVAITFAQIIGHTLNDIWTVTVETPARLNLSALGNKLQYKNVSGVLQALAGGDLKAGISATSVYSLGQNCYILNNPSTAAGTVATIPPLIRKDLTADYQVVPGDEGIELSCNGTFTVTLAVCPSVPSKYFWINNKGTGRITVSGNGYTVYGLYGAVGVTSLILESGAGAIQIGTNGVDYHIITKGSGLYLFSYQPVTAAYSATFTGLIPGLRYKLMFDLVHAGGTNNYYISFNSDTGANYENNFLQFSNTVVECVSVSTTSVLVCYSVTAGDGLSGEINFTTVPGNNKKVRVYGQKTSDQDLYGPGRIGGVISCLYTGAADLGSMTFYPYGGTSTGKLTLYQYG